MSALPRLTGPARERLLSSGRRIVITGASGWIGRATLELLHNTLGPGAFAERVYAFGSTRRTIDIRDGLTVEQQALADIGQLSPSPSLLLHLAFLTKDRVSGMHEADYCRANRALSSTVLEALGAIDARAVFVASSGAAAFANDPGAAPAMQLYGSLKKADEDTFANWVEASGRRAVICRIFALSGPHINKHDNYALASFIKDALAGRPIAIRANHPVLRSYVAIRELMSLVFALMLASDVGVVRFESGGEPMEMQEIAEAVSRVVGKVPVLRAAPIGDIADRYCGDSAAYHELLEKSGIPFVTFERQVMETAQFLSSSAGFDWRSGGEDASAVGAQ